MIPEAMLRIAAARSCELSAAQLESRYASSEIHQFSEKFERKIKKLKRKAKHPVFYRALRYVASVALAILVVGSAWLTVDVEARKAFFGWIKDVYKTYFSYHFEGKEVHTSQTDYRPTWVPEGYAETFCDNEENTVFTVYSNDFGEVMSFNYVSDPNNTTWFVDQNHTIIRQVSINGDAGTLFLSTDSENSNAIVWSNEDNTAFYLSGFLDEEELIRIAESVSSIKQ